MILLLVGLLLLGRVTVTHHLDPQGQAVTTERDRGCYPRSRY
jgi:hypothetical protein